MIKIIKEGKIPDDAIRIACKYCGCVIFVRLKYAATDFHNDSHIVYVCPCCERTGYIDERDLEKR